MNALANSEVGSYFQDHFVSSYQKVGTFRIVDGQKQGGNVASYFCTPSGNVLAAIAGPVDSATLLREARWVVETRKMGRLVAGGDLNQYRKFFRMAHAERLLRDAGLGGIDWPHMPLYQASAPQLAGLFQGGGPAQGLDRQGQIHLLLATFPLVKLDQAFQVVYDRILDERISTQPVRETNGSAPATSRTSDGLAAQALASAAEGSSQDYLVPLAEDAVPREREVSQARDNPSRADVCSGKALNVLLGDLMRLKARNLPRRVVEIEAKALQAINFMSDSGGAHLGLLKDGAKLRWPLAFGKPRLAKQAQPFRQSLEASLAETIARLKRGQLPDQRLLDARRDLDRLGTLLKGEVDDLPAGEYVEGKRYLAELTSELQFLEQPEAVRYLDGSLVPDSIEVKTVQDLVDFMSARGLRFAPSSSSNQEAYFAFREALASADRPDQPIALAGQGDL